MLHRRHLLQTLGALSAAALVDRTRLLAGAAEPNLTYRHADGGLRVRPPRVPDELRNPWPADEEDAFWRRANHVLATFRRTHSGRYGNTYFENEKQSYPKAMFDLLLGDVEPAVKFLQEEDNLRADNAHTLGIDYFPCFTLKGQMRKYFLFGQHLAPAYRQRMHDAGRIWTEQDPLRRPHPLYGAGDRSIPGWTPKTWGSWVDIRNTDNLRAMRDTSVYLLAEETGNEAVRQLYAEKIGGYVAALYHVGMSEWDSENYHGHTIAPYLNLYDFARERSVRAMAKAALDWLCMAAAMKYYRGGFGGPTKRDYGGANVVLGAGASHASWLYFGDCPVDDDHVEADYIHFITSAYRPPLAIVALARKQFERPVTLQNTKPAYGVNYPHDADAPQYWETLTYGRTYQLGSVVSAVSGDQRGLDVGPFKLLAENRRRGVDFVVVNTAPAGEEVAGLSHSKRPGDQVVQHRHMALWLRKDAERGGQFVFQAPRTAQLAVEPGWWFLTLEKTWLAVRPLHLAEPAWREIADNRAERYRDERLLVARATQAGFSGFGLIVGEADDYRSEADFRRRVQEHARLNLDRLEQGVVEWSEEHTAVRLKMFYNSGNDRPGLIRNGDDADWNARFELYRRLGAGDAPVALGWKEGRLRIAAGGRTFEQHVAADGLVTKLGR